MNASLSDAYGLPPASGTPHLHTVHAAVPAPIEASQPEKDEALPLPKWLLALYFLFPIVLYLPDAIFNFFVYSDGVTTPSTDNPLLATFQWALWGFLAVGVVGMAYLLSVLAPWHWINRHRLQAVFCGVGVVIATGITTWNSLAYRSTSFQAFATDQWAYSVWPWLQAQHVSITMILVAVAPPFWGLFWAIVQPTQTKRSLAHMQGTHQERVLKMHQDAELKALRAEANAKVRAAQLKGMAQTAAAARQQMGVVASQLRSASKPDGKGDGASDGRSDAPPPVREPRDIPVATPSPSRGTRMASGAGGKGQVRSVLGAPARTAGVSDPLLAHGVQPQEVTTAEERTLDPPRRRSSSRP